MTNNAYYLTKLHFFRVFLALFINMVASREAGYLVYGSYGIIYHWRIFALVLSTSRALGHISGTRSTRNPTTCYSYTYQQKQELRHTGRLLAVLLLIWQKMLDTNGFSSFGGLELLSFWHEKAPRIWGGTGGSIYIFWKMRLPQTHLLVII